MRGDIGQLIAANECILHKWMVLRARLAQPITKIAGRSLIEPNDVGAAAIDREITRAVRSEILSLGDLQLNKSCGRRLADGGTPQFTTIRSKSGAQLPTTGLENISVLVMPGRSK